MRNNKTLFWVAIFLVICSCTLLMWLAPQAQAQSGSDLGLVSIRPPVQPINVATPHVPFYAAGTITVAQTAPAVNARDYTSMVGLTATKRVIFKVPEDATIGEFRFRTAANADADVVQVWVARGHYMGDGSTVDSFGLGASLALTGGAQTAPPLDTLQFVDTIVVTPYLLSHQNAYDSGNDRMAVWRVDLQGYAYVEFIATTLASKTTLYVDVSWLGGGS